MAMNTLVCQTGAMSGRGDRRKAGFASEVIVLTGLRLPMLGVPGDMLSRMTPYRK
jgi:hypothetical protein